MKKTVIAAFLLIIAVVLCGCGKTEPVIPDPPVTSDPIENPDYSDSEDGNTDDNSDSTIPLNATDSPYNRDTEPFEVEYPEVSENGDMQFAPIEENMLVLTAQSLLGVPFADGGSTPDTGFDNSGFIHYVLSQNGYVNCPRGLYEQSVMGNHVDSIADLRSGDLVFFSDSGDKAQFGGIYIGGGIMISCRMPGESVSEIDITSSYYRTAYFTAVRVI
ncbi:MAG: NlpC/P60 family protein [Oscillospiraceae bacterium]|nr:NlpC/P60 family protein [Oscillospiraceae bacterium]